MAFLASSLICRRLLFRSRSVARMSTACKSAIPPSKTQNSSSPSPWLMLPPSFDDNTTGVGYNFYNLADNIVETRPQVKELNDFMPNPIRNLTLCGSSHGWITLFNSDTLDLFIYNPISLRHIKLPPLPGNGGSVNKLILSCSPDDEQNSSCRAVIMYNNFDALAVCCPGHSKKWTQIGNSRKSYEDIAYSARQNLLFGLIDYSDIETWDLSDPSSPRLIKMINTNEEKYYSDPLPQSLYDELPFRRRRPTEVDQYLVVAADDEILLVTRFVMGEVAPDGSCIDTWPGLLSPRMTIGFYIDVYDQEKDEVRPGLPSLGDLALFIGSCGDSFALSTTRFPELRSNSIYFTNEHVKSWDYYTLTPQLFGGHDIGIFDFENKTVSPCYYPCDRPSLQKIEPSPVWFFPRLP